ncbi:MAG TPA: hypothetical protein VFL88_13240 [Gemmatimonadales bacterium]|nr:hypothetical protein [Gemmatimonadales bacterium]
MAGTRSPVSSRLAIPVMLLLGLTSCSPPPAASQPQTITIAAHDYAFVLPDSLRPGATAFRLKNVGKVRHEAFVLLLKPGLNMAQLFDTVKVTGSPEAAVDETLGVLMARPGVTSSGTLLADLLPGRTYVLVCTFRDGPQDRPHFDLGMMASRTTSSS